MSFVPQIISFDNFWQIIKFDNQFDVSDKFFLIEYDLCLHFAHTHSYVPVLHKVPKQ